MEYHQEYPETPKNPGSMENHPVYPPKKIPNYREYPKKTPSQNPGSMENHWDYPKKTYPKNTRNIPPQKSIPKSRICGKTPGISLKTNPKALEISQSTHPEIQEKHREYPEKPILKPPGISRKRHQKSPGISRKTPKSKICGKTMRIS